MKITATLQNRFGTNDITVSTENDKKQIAIPPKQSGYGSSVNGGELLFLALATCCTNDLYREAKKRQMELISVEVDVSGEFGGEGEPASQISYSVRVSAPKHSAGEIQDLIQFVDGIAEIHNTLRGGINITLTP